LWWFSSQRERRVEGLKQVTDLVDGVGIVERPTTIHVRFPHVIAVLAAARVRGKTAVTAAAPAWGSRGNKFLELGLWTDAESIFEDGLHRLLIEPPLEDMLGDVELGLAANVCHVNAEHLQQGVREIIE